MSTKTIYTRSCQLSQTDYRAYIAKVQKGKSVANTLEYFNIINHCRIVESNDSIFVIDDDELLDSYTIDGLHVEVSCSIDIDRTTHTKSSIFALDIFNEYVCIQETILNLTDELIKSI